MRSKNSYKEVKVSHILILLSPSGRNGPGNANSQFVIQYISSINYNKVETDGRKMMNPKHQVLE